MEIIGHSDAEKARLAARDETVRSLAAKLGVEPIGEHDVAPMVAFVLSDGTRFSWEDLVFAHLAAMEKALGV